MGEDGSLLVGGAVGGGAVVQEPSFPVDHAIDATGAGDAYRAAFAVAYAEGQPVRECMRFAAAAGALAVTKLGAVPSLPSRNECELLMARGRHKQPKPEQLKPARRRFLADGVASPEAADGAVLTGGAVSGGRAVSSGSQWPSSCPWQFASRLNSMKDRADLWDGNDGVLGWVERQGSISGLNLVDFNFPQHLPSAGVSVSEAEEALAAAGLRAGAICMRYPKEFQAGGFTHPDAAMRRKAIDLTLEGCRWALSLGARELVVWSAYDGYDYPFQADHTIMWRRLVDAFREVCDAFPSLRISLEFKPTDENTRWFAVPSTGAALLLVDDIDRPNMGLTLDVGHCLAAGENPAQSAAMVGSRGKLWGVQLNDGYTRLGAEDGLAFGSVHPTLALEMVWWLQRYGFDGHVYFDTFPRNEDPVREAEYNIRRCRALWEKARRLDKQIETCITRQDAMSALEMLEENGA